MEQTNSNKILFAVIAVVALAIIISIIVNVNNTTGKAAYNTGEYGEECLSNIGVIFGCNPTNEEGTTLLDCYGGVANQPLDLGVADTATDVVLVAGFFTDESDVDLTRVWTSQGQCVSNGEFSGMVTDAIENIWRNIHDYNYDGYAPNSLPSEDLIFKEPSTSVFCDLGDIEEFFDIGPYSENYFDGIPIKLVDSSRLVQFNFKAMFENEVPNVAVCAISTGTIDEDYMHLLPNCWFWYPEGVPELLPGLGACCYEEEFNGFSNAENGNYVCEDRSLISCMSKLNSEWFEGEKCSELIEGPCALVGACYYGDEECEVMSSSECDSLSGEWDRGESCYIGPGSCCCFNETNEAAYCHSGAPNEWNCFYGCIESGYLGHYENYNWITNNECRTEPNGGDVTCPPAQPIPTGACCYEEYEGESYSASQYFNCRDGLHEDTCLNIGLNPVWHEELNCEDITEGNCSAGACCWWNHYNSGNPEQWFWECSSPTTETKCTSYDEDGDWWEGHDCDWVEQNEICTNKEEPLGACCCESGLNKGCTYDGGGEGLTDQECSQHCQDAYNHYPGVDCTYVEDRFGCPLPTGACCIAGGPGCVDDYTEQQCLGGSGHDWYEGESCPSQCFV